MRQRLRKFQRHSEADRFRRALIAIRREMGWSQEVLAAKLGISRRTLSYWENRYWLPPEKERLHVVLALREAGAENVLMAAAALHIRFDAACRDALAPFEAECDALDARAAAENAGRPPEAPLPPVPVPAPVPAPGPIAGRPSAAEVYAVTDREVKNAADVIDVRASALRVALRSVLAACAGAGFTLDEVRGALAPSEGEDIFRPKEVVAR